jgi:hypothetical protein
LYDIDYSFGGSFIAWEGTFVISSHDIPFIEFRDCQGLEFAYFYAFWLGFPLEKLLLV